MGARHVWWGGFLSVLLLASACGSNGSTPEPPAAGAECSERPGALPRPPTRGLPCELLPPSKWR